MLLTPDIDKTFLSLHISMNYTCQDKVSGEWFTNVSRALQNILSKSVHSRNHTSYENVKLKLCTCAQRMAFQLEILTINMISGIVYFRETILESSQNGSETIPRNHKRHQCCKHLSNGSLAIYEILRVAHAPGVMGTFSPPMRVSDLDMHHGTCVTHETWWMPDR